MQVQISLLSRCMLLTLTTIRETTYHTGDIYSLLHCLYEAQDPSLCQCVVEQLEGELNLNSTSLTPVDCLAVGYFNFLCLFYC